MMSSGLGTDADCRELQLLRAGLFRCVDVDKLVEADSDLAVELECGLGSAFIAGGS